MTTQTLITFVCGLTFTYNGKNQARVIKSNDAFKAFLAHCRASELDWRVELEEARRIAYKQFNENQ